MEILVISGIKLEVRQQTLIKQGGWVGGISSLASDVLASVV